MSLLVHCTYRSSVIELATVMGLKSSIPFEGNKYALTLEGSESDIEAFQTKHLNNNPNAIAFKNVMAGKFKSKIHSIKPSISSSVTSVNRTASYMAGYYNFPAPSSTHPKIGIISLGGTYLTADLQYYWTNVLHLTTIPTVSYVAVGGATNAPNKPIVSGDGSDENTLDIEIIGGCCPNANITVYFGANTESGFYSAISAAISAGVNVLSISWGAPESDYPASYLTSFDQLFASSTGTVVCVATGDDSCTDGVSGGLPHVDFPSSSPHVVACGGTSLAGVVESAWSYNASHQWGGGGGISAIFNEPSFQAGVVVYPTNTTPSVSYLRGHRGIPDIALNADPLSGWTIYFDGQLYTNTFGGTSCVAPAMSALLGLMNLSYPKGFLTDLYGVYKTTKVPFNDITIGSNDNIKRSTGLYNAKTGYDFCTGLGSLHGTALKTALSAIVSR